MFETLGSLIGSAFCLKGLALLCSGHFQLSVTMSRLTFSDRSSAGVPRVWVIGHSFITRHGLAVRDLLWSMGMRASFSFNARGGAHVHDLSSFAHQLALRSVPRVVMCHIGDNDVMLLSPVALTSALLAVCDWLSFAFDCHVLLIPLHPRGGSSADCPRYNRRAIRCNHHLAAACRTRPWLSIATVRTGLPSSGGYRGFNPGSERRGMDRSGVHLTGGPARRYELALAHALFDLMSRLD